MSSQPDQASTNTVLSSRSTLDSATTDRRSPPLRSDAVSCRPWEPDTVREDPVGSRTVIAVLGAVVKVFSGLGSWDE